MIKYYKTVDNRVAEIDEIENGCWVSCVAPDSEEIELLTGSYGLDAGFVKSSLDEEEASRIENEDDQTLVIVDYAVAEADSTNSVQYYTMPMGIVLTKTNVFTISIKDNVILEEMRNGTVRNVQTHLKTQFVLTVLLRISSKYLQYLKNIDKLSSLVEKQLHRSLRNKELFQLLALEKSLVYFSTSLKSDEMTLEKILRGRVIKLYEDDQDLLEDVLIEIKQAIDMSNIYSSILSGTMDAFASIISNNVNFVMKRLTIITILMAIPTIVFSYYGMNVTNLPFAECIIPVPLILSVVATVITGIIMLKTDKNMK